MFLHEENLDSEPVDIPKEKIPSEIITIPRLTDLIYYSIDPDIRPLMKVFRVYPYPPLN